MLAFAAMADNMNLLTIDAESDPTTYIVNNIDGPPQAVAI